MGTSVSPYIQPSQQGSPPARAGVSLIDAIERGGVGNVQAGEKRAGGDVGRHVARAAVALYAGAYTRSLFRST